MSDDISKKAQAECQEAIKDLKTELVWFDSKAARCYELGWIQALNWMIKNDYIKTEDL